MILDLKPGIENKITKTVGERDTASYFGEEHMPVLATGLAIAFMEYTALSSVQSLLPDGYSSVGIEVNMKHLKPAPVGIEVTCHSRLTEISGRKLYFEISLRSDEGLLATCAHTRAVVQNDAFQRIIKTSE